MTALVTRPFDPSTDQAGVLALCEEVFGLTATPGMWRWKYVPPWTERFYCWVAVVDGRVVGYVGAVPLRGLVDGREVPWFQIADAMVHPDHRLVHDWFEVGTRQLIEDLGRARPEHLLYGFSDHRAFFWLKRLGLVDRIEHARAVTARANGSSGAGRWSFHDWSWSEAVLEPLWSSCRSQVRAGLIRDRDYLAWRYGSHPVHDYRLLGVHDEGRPVGWVVLGDGPDGSGVPVIDLLLPDRDRAGALRALAGELGSDVLAWLPGRLSAGLDDVEELKTNVYHFLHRSAAPTTYLRENLYYTMGDVDWW